MVEEQAEVKTEEIVTTGDIENEDVENVSTGDIKKEDVEKGAEPSLLEMKIIRQVEYYFGNVNLGRDKFLKEKIKEDDGWVTIECLTTFNRLQALSTDFDEIVNALAKSKTGLIEIHDSKIKIRRSPEKPLPDQDDPILRKASKMKTLYMKGFPSTYTLDDVQDFILSQGYQHIFIKMRLDGDRKFKGSIFVELSTIEEAKQILGKEIKLADEILKVMTREDYFSFKSEKGRRKKPNESGVEKNKDSIGETEEQKPPKKLGCVLHFKGADEKTSREDVKEVFGKHGEEIEWIDFSIGETQGYVRFKETDGAKKVLEAVKGESDSKIIIKEKEVEARVIEGIEENNYWILAMEDKRRPKFPSNRGRKRRDKGQEGWRKRRRPWENNKKTEISEEKTENTHIKFEDDNSAKPDTKDSHESPEKKAKVETTET